MLYEFHRSQNAKSPGVVHATYLVYGTKKATDGPSTSHNGTDGDIEMASSPPEAESLAEVVPTFTMSLVPEEQLKGMLLFPGSVVILLTGVKKPLRTMKR
jgi:DNA polymerase delta subunit 3